MKKSIALGVSVIAATLGMNSIQTSSTATVRVDNVRSGKTHSVAQQNQQTQRQSTQNQVLQNEGKNTSHKIINNRLDYIPSYYNVGIPPKIYGMRYVKRGTHKRNNI